MKPVPSGFAALLFLMLGLWASGCGALPEFKAEGNPSDGPVATEAPSSGAEGPEAGERKDLRNPEPAEIPSKGSYGGELLREEHRENKVLANVAGEEIKASDLFQVFFLANPVTTREILENLVLYSLVHREALRLGVRVEKRQAAKVLERLLEEQQGRIAMNLDEEVSLEHFVRVQYGMEMAAYRDLLLRTAVFSLLLDRCVRYTELTVRRLRIGVIIVKERDKAEKIRKKIMKGADFEVLARENSIDPSGTMGGILPPLPADMDYPIVKETLKLGKGEVSEVEEADLGKEKVYRILKLVEILEPVRGSYPELASKVEKNLEEQPVVVPEMIRYWQLSLRGRYNVERRLP